MEHAGKVIDEVTKDEIRSETGKQGVSHCLYAGFCGASYQELRRLNMSRDEKDTPKDSENLLTTKQSMPPHDESG